jgi:hypothetical protein
MNKGTEKPRWRSCFKLKEREERGRMGMMIGQKEIENKYRGKKG